MADETDPAMRERCMELLAESARTSANKLKFFRLAFGAAGGFGDMLDPREARIAIEGLLSDARRTQLGWMVEAEALPKAAVKVLLNLAMIANEALVRGGQLDIGAEAAGGRIEIVVRIEGQRIILDPELRAMLTGGLAASALVSRTAAAYMIHELVAGSGGSDGSVMISEPAPNVMIFGAVMVAG
jgi:histidine phosphotransferase ChpT